MLVIQPKARMVERTVRGKSGKFWRICFLVVELEGQIFWKVLRVEPVMARDFGAPKSRAALPARKQPVFAKRTEPKPQPIISPYIPQTFFISQLIRAPARASEPDTD